VADWGGGISVVLHRGSNCPLSRAMDGRIMRRRIISSCQSAATSEIVKRCCSSFCKQCYSKLPFTFAFTTQFTPCSRCPPSAETHAGWSLLVPGRPRHAPLPRQLARENNLLQLIVAHSPSGFIVCLVPVMLNIKTFIGLNVY